MKRLLLGTILLGLGLLLVGCSDDETTSTPTTSQGGTGGAGGVGGSGGSGASSNACAELAQAAQDSLELSFASETRAGGTVAAMLTPECGLWEGAAGEASSAVPLTPQHLMRVGSITKTYTAATVLLLVAEGALGLDDILEPFVPGVPNGDRITVRQLLNHTAGVYNYTDDATFVQQALADPDTAYTPQQIVDVAISHGAQFEPGTDWEYSNTGYILLGMIIESVSAQAAGPAIRTRVLDPQALAATFLDGEEALVGELARGHSVSGADVTVAVHPSVPWTAGSMVATATDVVRWATALYRGETLAQPEMTAMLDGVDLGFGNEYGLGVWIRGPLSALGASYGHGGSIYGYHSEVFYFVDLDSTIATVVNSDAGDPYDALAALHQLLVEQ